MLVFELESEKVDEVVDVGTVVLVLYVFCFDGQIQSIDPRVDSWSSDQVQRPNNFDLVVGEVLRSEDEPVGDFPKEFVELVFVSIESFRHGNFEPETIFVVVLVASPSRGRGSWRATMSMSFVITARRCGVGRTSFAFPEIVVFLLEFIFLFQVCGMGICNGSGELSEVLFVVVFLWFLFGDVGIGPNHPLGDYSGVGDVGKRHLFGSHDARRRGYLEGRRRR